VKQMGKTPLNTVIKNNMPYADPDRKIKELEAASEKGKQAEIALKNLEGRYFKSLKLRDTLGRQLFALRAMLKMPELYLDPGWNIVGYSADFPLLTKRVYEMAKKRKHIREFLSENNYEKLENYLARVRALEDLPYDKGARWKLVYKGPNSSDKIDKTWIAYRSVPKICWDIVEHDGKWRIVHKPHIKDEVDCYLMSVNQYGGPDEDLKVIYKIKTPKNPDNIRDLTAIISGASGTEDINPDFVGYTICTASNYNAEGRIQRRSANMFVRPEILSPDTEYQITVERTGGRIQKLVKNLVTQVEEPPLKVIDTESCYDEQNHVGFHSFSGEAEFFDVEIYTRKSMYSIDQFKIPFDFEVGIKDKNLKGRVFKLKIGKDESMGRTLYMLMFEDITSRKEAEDALRESEEKYRTLFERSKDALCTITSEGKFVDVNQSLLDLFGYTREEMKELDASRIYVNPNERIFFQREIEIKEHVKDYELKLKKKNGAEMHCQIAATVIKDKEKKVWGYQLNVNDITERKHLAKKDQPYFGSSVPMKKVMELALMAAENDTTIILTGETGSGKGVLAQWIHEHSQRRSRSFVEINCSGLKGEMLASELFGHVKGAFTSAVQDRRGLIQFADGGTLFLDEISNMALSVQGEFLKVIEEKQYRRMGEDKVRKSDFRLICSTNKDLFEEVRLGRFRQDLYFRIHVFPIYCPPLRKRPQDLPGLIQHILETLGSSYTNVSREVIELLVNYHWPGNIRELRNVLERALLLARGGSLSVEHFPGLSPLSTISEQSETVWDLKNIEKAHIRELLNRFQGDKEKTAEALGISRATLYRKLK